MPLVLGVLGLVKRHSGVDPSAQTFGVMNTALGISILALTVGVWFFFKKRRADTEFENTFRGRESLSDDDFYAEFYQDFGISCEVVMVDVALVDALEKRFKIAISDKEAEDTKTVHDIITFVHRKTHSA